MTQDENQLPRLVSEELAIKDVGLKAFLELLPAPTRAAFFEWLRGDDPRALDVRDALETALVWAPGSVTKVLESADGAPVDVAEMREWVFVNKPRARSAADLSDKELLFEMRRRARITDQMIKLVKKI